MGHRGYLCYRGDIQQSDVLRRAAFFKPLSATRGCLDRRYRSFLWFAIVNRQYQTLQNSQRDQTLQVQAIETLKLFRMLATVFVHHDRGSDADIETLGLAKLWNRETLNLIQSAVKADSMLLMAHDEGAFFRKLCCV